MKTYQQRAFGARKPFVASICLSYLVANHLTPTLYASPPQKGGKGAIVSGESFEVADQPVSEILKAYEQPRVRYVLGTKAVVRSGPAERYYATNELPAGSRVEVYIETNDGWSGIRPLSDNYNWILAKHAYLLPGGKIAEISEQETPAWVGTDAANIGQLMWQTALVKSQQVQILGEEYQIGEDGAKQLWYRISPPQGEFRWVRSSVLTDQVPASSTVSTKPPKMIKEIETNPIQPASYSQVVGSGVTKATAQEVQVTDVSDGQIVWSDESEVVARINQEIRNEQSEIMGQLPSGPQVEGSIILDDVSVVDGAMPVHMAMTPQELLRAKKRQQAQHQIDSFRQWDSMQHGPNGLPKHRPLGSILGLVGLGIIETERAPVYSQMRQSRSQFDDDRRSSSMPIQYGSSRLERLPRPGQRSGTSGRSRNDAVYDDTYDSDLLGAKYDRDSQPLESQRAISQRPIMEQLLTSNQPLFGSDPSPQTPPGLFGNPNQQEPSARDWYGINSPVTRSVADNERSSWEASEDDPKFSTPEVQRSLLELSSIVSRPTEEWELGRLRTRCLDWIETGDSAIVRGEARLLLDRIEQFETLRYKTLQSFPKNENPFGARGSMLANQPFTIPSQTMPPSGVVPASTAGDYASHNVQFAGPADLGAGDASGWLVQVHATTPGQPEYALTDDAGKVITYVRSTASLNLRRYLQQPVMVQGVRGYIPALAAKQIVAERVVRLR